MPDLCGFMSCCQIVVCAAAGGVFFSFIDREVAIKCLVSVMVWLERSFDWDAQVIGLILAELSQLDVKSSQMRPGHLFVQSLGQHVNSDWVLARVGEQINLSQNLVSE